MPDPGALAAAAAHWQQQLEAIGALHALVQCAAREQQLAGGGGRDASSSGGEGALLAVDALPAAAGGGRFGTTPLLHFIYKLSARQQYVMSPFSAPLLEGGLQQVRVCGVGWGGLWGMEGFRWTAAEAGRRSRGAWEARGGMSRQAGTRAGIASSVVSLACTLPPHPPLPPLPALQSPPRQNCRPALPLPCPALQSPPCGDCPAHRRCPALPHRCHPLPRPAVPDSRLLPAPSGTVRGQHAGRRRAAAATLRGAPAVLPVGPRCARRGRQGRRPAAPPADSTLGRLHGGEPAPASMPCPQLCPAPAAFRCSLPSPSVTCPSPSVTCPSPSVTCPCPSPSSPRSLSFSPSRSQPRHGALPGVRPPYRRRRSSGAGGPPWHVAARPPRPAVQPAVTARTAALRRAMPSTQTAPAAAWLRRLSKGSSAPRQQQWRRRQHTRQQ